MDSEPFQGLELLFKKQIWNNTYPNSCETWIILGLELFNLKVVDQTTMFEALVI